jgi:hypothetical protein
VGIQPTAGPLDEAGEPEDRRVVGLLRFADRHRYLLLSSVLVALMTSQTLNQQWSTDFWEHGAVVRELATHLLHPRHPLLPVDATHPYFSPYTVAVGALAKLLGMGPVGALSVAAVLNLVLFLVGFRLFVARLAANPLAPFSALLFTLVLWGVSPWRWSGFLNLNSLGFGLPYPSMFATAIACCRSGRWRCSSTPPTAGSSGCSVPSAMARWSC